MTRRADVITPVLSIRSSCSIIVCLRDSEKTADLPRPLPANETFFFSPTVFNRCRLQSKAINEAVLASRVTLLALLFAE